MAYLCLPAVGGLRTTLLRPLFYAGSLVTVLPGACGEGAPKSSQCLSGEVSGGMWVTLCEGGLWDCCRALLPLLLHLLAQQELERQVYFPVCECGGHTSLLGRGSCRKLLVPLWPTTLKPSEFEL